MLSMRLAIFMLFIASSAADRDDFAATKHRQSGRVASFLRLMRNHRSSMPDASKNLYGGATAKCGQQQCGIDPPAIHAICIDLPRDFCGDTGQADASGKSWCDDVGTDQHCVCLGAWSLYVRKGEDSGKAVPNLHCDAIPAAVFTDDYISSWATWNGKEIPGQEEHGLQKLFDKCNKDGSTFKQTFCTFVEGATHLKAEQKQALKSHANCA